MAKKTKFDELGDEVNIPPAVNVEDVQPVAQDEHAGKRKVYRGKPQSGVALSYDYGYPAERYFVVFNHAGEFSTDDPVVMAALDLFIEKNQMGIGVEWV